jgi:serine/threonine-protein kinase
MMKSLRLASALAIAALTGRADAQSVNAEADALFTQGRELVAAGKLAEGCAAFEASQKLDPSVGTLLNAADCREQNHQLAAAWALYHQAERMSAALTDDIGRRRHQTAIDRAQRLEARMSTLTIEVADEDRALGVEVRRDGEVVIEGVWGHPLPIDGGTYKITATAPGHEPWSSSVEVGPEGDARAVRVPPLPAVKAAPPVARRPVAPPRDRSRALPIAATAGAIALSGGAIGFELWGDSIYARAKSSPDKQTGNPLWQQANTRRYIAEAMLGGSIACASAAIWLWLRGDDEGPPAPAARIGSFTVAPVGGVGLAGVSLEGRW